MLLLYAVLSYNNPLSLSSWNDL